MNHFRIAMGLLVGLVGAGAAGVPQAQAAPSLILLQDNGSSNPVYRQTIENLASVIVSGNLGRHYDHIDLLTGERATREQLFERIRKRGLKGMVDVVILTHGTNERLLLSLGDVRSSDIRAAGPFPRLRMVYMMACYSASVESAWRDAGAAMVVGHQDVNSLPGFFFPRFLRRWSEGATARRAAEEAYRFSEGAAGQLSRFIKNDDLLSQIGIARSEPILLGIDLDRSGRNYPDRDLTIHPLAVTEPRRATRVEKPQRYSHSDFERTGLELLGAMIPQASLDPATIPSAQELVDLVSPLAWEQLKDSFPNPSAVPGLDLPQDEGEAIWIDGEAVRFFLDGLREFAGELIAPVLDRIQGVRLTRRGEQLRVGIYFDRKFRLAIKDEKAAANWEPYAVELPRTIRFSIRMTEGVLVATGLDQGGNAAHLKLKMPGLPDTVWLRQASLGFADGRAVVEAGVLGNLLSVIARGEILARRFEGVDIWASIERNLRIWMMPELRFKPL